jgi:peptidoglycan/xylan/chitin deacetylase (PgdA/CDA1 family)
MKAVFTLPLVFLGIHRDPWYQFDRCFELEGDSPSTFFFIPYKNRVGEGFKEKRDKYRAAKYDVEDVYDILGDILARRCEAGVHGIDAWHSVMLGMNELDRLRAITGQQNIGIRMHWLCRNESTFRVLDQAGYHYDSTFGYNDSIGFRAGTAQVYMPFGVRQLLEIPLHIQDTALFNPGRMHATAWHAAQLCDQLIENVDKYKGVLTILWHQRSLGPERLWGNFYKMLIQKLRSKNAWLATAGGIVDWFQIRRLALFKPNSEVEFACPFKNNSTVPPLVLRKYHCEKGRVTKSLPSAPGLGQSDYNFAEETIRPFSS